MTISEYRDVSGQAVCLIEIAQASRNPVCAGNEEVWTPGDAERVKRAKYADALARKWAPHPAGANRFATARHHGQIGV